MKLVGREYKTMLDPGRFTAPGPAVEVFWEELKELARMTSVRTAGGFDAKLKRRITFLDTPDFTLRRNGLILRRRSGDDADEYTLKCRSEDRYFAAGTDVRPVGGTGPETKLEEDIAPPFRCRYAHSGTTALDGKPPATVGDAAQTFPSLKTLTQDGRPLARDLPLTPVHHLTMFERVYKGASLLFDGLGPDGNDESATVALIVWTNGKSGRPLVAEFSFRVKDKDERFTRGLALAAREFFQVVLRHDWSRPDGLTKTEYVYRDTRGD